MNSRERNELGLHITNLAMYYGRQINPLVISMFLNDLSDFSYAEILVALRKYRTTPGCNRFPLPNDLVKIMRPTIDNKNQAIEAASRIIEAVGTFGWPNPEQAKSFIGELGWRVVERIGGWKYICENLGTTFNLGTFTAQARDLANSTLERNELGLDCTAPKLNKSNKKVASLLAENDLNNALQKGKTND